MGWGHSTTLCRRRIQLHGNQYRFRQKKAQFQSSPLLAPGLQILTDELDQ